MRLDSALDWMAWGGLVLPLVVLAWSALQFVWVRTEEARQKKFDNFFITLERVHNASGSMIAQKGAIFELRNYPKYKEVILRICDDAPTLFGTNPDQRIINEFANTAAFLRR
jgi:hypothetical protein